MAFVDFKTITYVRAVSAVRCVSHVFICTACMDRCVDGMHRLYMRVSLLCRLCVSALCSDANAAMRKYQGYLAPGHDNAHSFHPQSTTGGLIIDYDKDPKAKRDANYEK